MVQWDLIYLDTKDSEYQKYWCGKFWWIWSLIKRSKYSIFPLQEMPVLEYVFVIITTRKNLQDDVFVLKYLKHCSKEVYCCLNFLIHQEAYLRKYHHLQLQLSTKQLKKYWIFIRTQKETAVHRIISHLTTIWKGVRNRQYESWHNHWMHALQTIMPFSPGQSVKIFYIKYFNIPICHNVTKFCVIQYLINKMVFHKTDVIIFIKFLSK